VVLNGAEGVTELFTKALSLGGAGFGMARQLMDSMQLAKAATDKPATNGTVGDDFGLSLPKSEK
jgi:ribosomal protein L6P/L9E